MPTPNLPLCPLPYPTTENDDEAQLLLFGLPSQLPLDLDLDLDRDIERPQPRHDPPDNRIRSVSTTAPGASRLEQRRKGHLPGASGRARPEGWISECRSPASDQPGPGARGAADALGRGLPERQGPVRRRVVVPAGPAVSGKALRGPCLLACYGQFDGRLPFVLALALRCFALPRSMGDCEGSMDQGSAGLLLLELRRCT